MFGLPGKAIDRTPFEPGDSSLRLPTIVRLRWFAIIGQLLAVAVVAIGLGFPMPVGACLVAISVSAWLNVFLRVRFSSRHRLGTGLTAVLLAYDILQLGALLYLTGGIENPFTILIVAPVVVSAASLPRRHTIVLGAVAIAVTAALIVWHMPLPWFPGERLELPLLYRLGQFAAVGACITFLALYTWRLSKEGREMSAALTATELVLAREQKLHALDGLAAAAAHELGTPLATIVLVTKELEREAGITGMAKEDIALLRSQAQRAREILQKLTQRPTEQDPLHASVTLSQMIEEAAAPHRVFAIAIEVDVKPYVNGQASPRPEPVAERRPGVIYGLGNLIENAVEFAANRVTVKARWNEREVSIAIADDGAGFRADVLDAIGDPYVTTRPAAAAGEPDDDGPTGLGLGFFIAKTLLERSGATLALANRTAPETGAIVRITWPVEAFTARREPLPVGDWPGADRAPSRARSVEVEPHRGPPRA